MVLQQESFLVGGSSTMEVDCNLLTNRAAWLRQNQEQYANMHKLGLKRKCLARAHCYTQIPHDTVTANLCLLLCFPMCV